MEQPIPLESLPPRDLRCRSHYKIYLMILLFVAVSIIAYWTWRINASSWVYVYEEAEFEIHLSLTYFFFFECFYLTWLQDKLNRLVQVYTTHVAITKGKEVETLYFAEIESYKIVCWSIFYFKTKDDQKFYFNSSLERIDYIWEGFRNARPDLVDSERYEAFRLKLVQYDLNEFQAES